MKPIRQITCATQNENCVAQILLDLPNIIFTIESASAFKWGCRKRRSRFNHSNSFRKNHVKRRPHSKDAAESCAAAAAASSPVTPLAFSPSESDRKKPKYPSKTSSLKRSREKYTVMINELTQRRDLLREEIGNVTSYYNKLIAYNSQLKAMKQEVLNSCQKKEEPKISRYGHEFSLGQPQPLVSAEKIHFSVGPVVAQYNGLGAVGPIGIPDLNISAEETIFRDRRSRFAEARRRRKDIIKIKIMKSKLPRTR